MSEKKARKINGIFKQLYYSPSVSCADLSERINKSLPYTMSQLNELVECGLVLETGQAPSTGGRRPQMYCLKPDLFYVVSVALDQFVARIAIMDLQNNFAAAPARIGLKLHNNPEVLGELTLIIEEYIAKSGIDKRRIAGVGIGMPGFIDVNKGVNYSIGDEQSVTEYISGRTGLPVFVDNDSSIIALAELKFGIARDAQNAMVINIGWGVGLGLILGGELFRGSNGFAGEFSHIPLFANNKLCDCGKYGCLETESSLFVIVEKAIKALSEGKLSLIKKEELNADHLEQSFEAIRAAAAKGDKLAIGLFSESGYHIGRGAAILIHLFNPDVVILSGRGSLAGKVWLPPIQQALNDHCVPKISEHTEIKISKLGHQAGLIGAAALVMEHCDEMILDRFLNRREVKVS